jgi:hypothetical protein
MGIRNHILSLLTAKFTDKLNLREITGIRNHILSLLTAKFTDKLNLREIMSISFR